MLQKKLKRFTSQELPILVKRVYLMESCKLTKNCKVSSDLVEDDISSSSDVNIMFESEAHTETELDSGSERGSPRPARAGSNLVGRGIANPMSERTRGFEMSTREKS